MRRGCQCLVEDAIGGMKQLQPGNPMTTPIIEQFETMLTGGKKNTLLRFSIHDSQGNSSR